MQRLEVSGAVRPLYGSLGVKGLILRQRTIKHSHTHPIVLSLIIHFCMKEIPLFYRLDLEKVVLLVCSQVVPANFTAGCYTVSCSYCHTKLATHAPLAAKCWPEQMRS